MPVLGALLLYCRLLSRRAFAGTQVLSLQSVEDVVHLPFPSRGEPGLAHHLTGTRDGFRGLTTPGTERHSCAWVVACWGWVYYIYIFFIIGSRKRLICSVAAPIILRSSCPSMFVQPFSFHWNSSLKSLAFKQASSFLVLLILWRENIRATLPLNHQTSAFQPWTFISKELMNGD